VGTKGRAPELGGLIEVRRRAEGRWDKLWSGESEALDTFKGSRLATPQLTGERMLDGAT
jgi:hypothetical protein